MKLRKLKKQDAPMMLEWMHDPQVVENMKTDFLSKTIQDCERFIEQAQDTSESLHLAIADDCDEYMGTVSLKHIRDKTAELGITVRRCAMGKGFSAFGMKEIIRTGFEKLALKCIYWCVDPLNGRAVRFYEKNGCRRGPCPAQAEDYSREEKERFLWFSVSDSDLREEP